MPPEVARRGIPLPEAPEDQPATMADIHALTQITDGLDKAIADVQRRIPTPEEIQAAVAAGIRQGMRESISDKDFLKDFWEAGYENLAKHAQTNAQTWIGKRVMHTLSAAFLVAALVWGVKSGRIG